MLSIMTGSLDVNMHGSASIQLERRQRNYVPTYKDSGQGFVAESEFLRFSLLPGERKRCLRERERVLEVSERSHKSKEYLRRSQGVVMGRSVGGIDLNSCFSQLFIRQNRPALPPSSTPKTTTSAGVGKAATYFNSSFLCEFLA